MLGKNTTAPSICTSLNGMCNICNRESVIRDGNKKIGQQHADRFHTKLNKYYYHFVSCVCDVLNTLQRYAYSPNATIPKNEVLAKHKAYGLIDLHE